MAFALGNFLNRRADDVRSATSRSVRYHGQPDWTKEFLWAQITQHYEVGEFINSGRDGTILRRARHLDDDSSYAMKIIPVHDPKNRERTAKESELLSRLAHKHIIRLVEQWESKDEVVLVLDLCDGGDFLDRLNNGGKFTEAEARRYFKQLVRALEYMHSKGVVHRDIKLDNLGIKLGEKPQLKVLDFGFAENYTPGEILTVSCGTLEYAAPELLRPRGQVFYKPEAIDVWSAGVCLFAFVTGTLPFDSCSDEDFIATVKDPNALHIPMHISPALQQLIASLLNVDPAQRPSFSQILASPWLRSGSQTTKAPARDPLTPGLARKRVKPATKESSFWRSILSTLKITEP